MNVSTVCTHAMKVKGIDLKKKNLHLCSIEESNAYTGLEGH